MSHFVLMVISESGVPSPGLLDRYDERIPVDPYQEQCWCVGLQAKQVANMQADAEMPVEIARQEFYNRPDVKALVAASKAAGNHGFSSVLDTMWHHEYEQPREARLDQLINESHQKDKPNPHCTDCGGLGSVTTNTNPLAKFDSYRLGGQWADLFALLQRKDISDLKTSTDPDGNPLRCFAVLTPDGVWHEKGAVGWLGIVDNEIPDAEWNTFFDMLPDMYANHKVLFYDCHV